MGITSGPLVGCSIVLTEITAGDRANAGEHNSGKLKITESRSKANASHQYSRQADYMRSM